jgi:hypothetical protein
MKLDLPGETIVYGWVQSREIERATKFWRSFGFEIGQNPSSGNTVMHARLSRTKAELPKDQLEAILAKRIE